MTSPTPRPPRSIEQLLTIELGLLGADRTDTHVVECLRYARRLDDEDTDPQVAHGAARQLNVRLLALQHAYWRAGTLPPLLSKAMHERAAAVHARLPKRIRGTFTEDHPNRPAGISIADRQQAYLDADQQRAQLEASEALWGSDS